LHVSSPSQTVPFAHGVPVGLGAPTPHDPFVHRPSLQGYPGQTLGVPPHVPSALHASLSVHALLSLQDDPVLGAPVVQLPLTSQTPFWWHWSPGQVTGPAVQRPLWH
jgi:hypothetical protein